MFLTNKTKNDVIVTSQVVIFKIFSIIMWNLPSSMAVSNLELMGREIKTLQRRELCAPSQVVDAFRSPGKVVLKAPRPQGVLATRIDGDLPPKF